MNAPELQPILSRIPSGPIRHACLADELLKVIGTVHRTIGKYLGINLEQFEIGFMRAKAPETEIAMWNSIAMAWTIFQQKNIRQVQVPHSEAKTIIAALVAISMGAQKPESLGVPVAVGKQLLVCFDEALGP
jgi:hypothetical protein